jgi:hypothetical protein
MRRVAVLIILLIASRGGVLRVQSTNASIPGRWFADANQLPKSQNRQSEFGGVIGGPILKSFLRTAGYHGYSLGHLTSDHNGYR